MATEALSEAIKRCQDGGVVSSKLSNGSIELSRDNGDGVGNRSLRFGEVGLLSSKL